MSDLLAYKTDSVNLEATTKSIESLEIKKEINTINNIILDSLGLESKILCSDSAIKQKEIEFSIIDAFKKNKEFSEVEYLYNGLPRLYNFRKPFKVFKFLEENLYLISALSEIYWEIHKYFPYDELFLEIFKDPTEIDFEELFIIVQTTFDRKEAHKRLNTFDDNYWLDASILIGNNVCVHVEYL